MSNMKDKIIGVTVGIRFKRKFRIPEKSGEIIDKILSDTNSPFSGSYFDNLQDRSKEKVLINSRTEEYLRINTDDIIFGIKIDKNFDEKFDWIKEKVLPYLEKEIFSKFEINEIKRLGIIFSHRVERIKNANEIIRNLTNGNLEKADNININFSKKLTAFESAKKGVNDFVNTIYNFSEIEGMMLAELDYQYYYDPLIEDIRECFTDTVLQQAKSYLEHSFYKWLEDANK